MTDRIPTRWLSQMEGQLADADRRLEGAQRHLENGEGGRALEEVYPGVMAAAMVKVWLKDEPWHTPRSFEDMSRMVRDELPSGFATLFEMKLDQRSLAGWRAGDAQPLIGEAREFIATVRAEVERCRTPQTG